MFLSLSDPHLSLRPITNADEPLLFAIYASTRETEMQRVPHWTEEQKNAFLLQQFTAQHVYYHQQYKGAHFCVIQKKEEPVGRLYVAPEYGDGTIRIMDITLLPAYRNRGYGKAILQDVMKMAEKHKKNITIHVESFNPARQLYERLGFRIKDRKNEVYLLMEWQYTECIA